MKRLTKIALLVSAALLAGQLYAQTAPPAGVPATPEAKPATFDLTPDQMKRESQVLRDRVRADIQKLQYLQTKARDSKDIIKLTCVNDRYIKLKAEANLFDQAHRDLIAVLDVDARHGAYKSVLDSASGVRKAREEADVCVGTSEVGAASANDFTSPDIIDDPTLSLPFDIQVEPPAYASPYI